MFPILLVAIFGHKKERKQERKKRKEKERECKRGTQKINKGEEKSFISHKNQERNESKLIEKQLRNESKLIEKQLRNEKNEKKMKK